MELLSDIDIKSVVIGAAIAAVCVIVGHMYTDFAYPFSAIGFIYVGYKAKNLIYGTILGAFAATPIIYLAFDGKLGQFSGFFLTPTGSIIFALIILFVGAFIGFVGAWAKRDRVKAKEQYEKQQKIGKNKKKNKKNDKK